MNVRSWHTVDELTEMKVRSERGADIYIFVQVVKFSVPLQLKEMAKTGVGVYSIISYTIRWKKLSFRNHGKTI